MILRMEMRMMMRMMMVMLDSDYGNHDEAAGRINTPLSHFFFVLRFDSPR
jgi:hypothetical protein